MRNQETLEEAALKFSKKFLNNGDNSEFEAQAAYLGFVECAKWQQEINYSDMQEYATFCIECDRKGMPLLLVEDWYKHYKNK